jgi:hypothetical protein
MNAIDTLMFLVFFAPLAIMVGMNLVLYRDPRYTLCPPMPARTAVSGEPAPVETVEYELRKAA